MKKYLLIPLLYEAETAYIETQNLLPLLENYANPRDLLARLVKNGDLIRLKNGFFVIAEKIAKEPVPFAQIGNLLYGPSYLSYEWALSYYGLIPEGVYVVSSACAAKSKSFKTPLGTFDYFYLNHERYAVGIQQEKNQSGHFLIATPEKALADLIHQKSRHLIAQDLLTDLIEARRMDPHHLKNLSLPHLVEIAERYHSPTVHQLMKALKQL